MQLACACTQGVLHACFVLDPLQKPVNVGDIVRRPWSLGEQVGTKGLQLTFNNNGIRHLASDPELELMFEFFQTVRCVDANAWKLNLWFSDSAPGFAPHEGIFRVHHGAALTNTNTCIHVELAQDLAYEVKPVCFLM